MRKKLKCLNISYDKTIYSETETFCYVCRTRMTHLDNYQIVICENCVSVIRLQKKEISDPKYRFEICEFCKNIQKFKKI
jgi:hypothetical protein